jgi:flagellin
MRIDSGSFGLVQPLDATSKTLQKNNNNLSKILQKLSTALQINSASDNAAGLGIAQQLTTQARGFKMATQNVNDAMSALNIADSTGSQVSDLVSQQRDLAVQASNDTLTNSERQDLNTQYQSLTQEIDQISNSSQFNTQNVANGTGLATGNAQIQAGPNSGDTVNMPAVNMTATALGITGTSIGTAANAQAALGQLDNAMSALDSQQATLGAMTDRFQSAVNNLSIADINTQAAESVVSDEDMANGLTQLTSSELLQQSATEAFSKFNQISANHLFGLLSQ